MTKRERMEMDGVMEAPAVDFHTFARHIYAVGRFSGGVTVPAEVLRHLQLAVGDYVQVAIRKISKEDAVSIFGYCPRTEAVQVSCPVCGARGSLRYVLRGTPNERLYVHHLRKHGFSERQVHFIRETAYPDFYRQYSSAGRRGEP
jgi:hypothetical protein